ncbi:hypothetical protein LWM68_15810 [Niabella sp. W65]|nr:hypothetical protein [Niabella sp. W65]MCH7364092.1 hypothetical protein [Niabella sp. W65]
MPDQQHLDALYQKFLQGNCNHQELEELLLHFEQIGTDSALIKQIREQLEADDLNADNDAQVQRIVKATDEHIAQLLQNKPLVKRYRIFKYSIAASIILAISLGGYF